MKFITLLPLFILACSTPEKSEKDKQIDKEIEESKRKIESIEKERAVHQAKADSIANVRDSLYGE